MSDAYYEQTRGYLKNWQSLLARYSTVTSSNQASGARKQSSLHNTSMHTISGFGQPLTNAGICSSNGTIYDFAGFGVTKGSFAFGNPTKYLQLNPEAATVLRGVSGSEDSLPKDWDLVLDRSAAVFEAVHYNFVTTNCHAFVQYFLQTLAFSNSQWWGAVKLVRPH
jgi:hypothetical protein